MKTLTIFANENRIRKSKAQNPKLKINSNISKSKRAMEGIIKKVNHTGINGFELGYLNLFWILNFGF